MRGIEQFLQVDAATLGALKYAGTWNASTNTPTLASGVGVQGQYYVVSVAGSTNLDGETNWGVGDWAVFNGSVWQKVDGGSTGLLTTLTVTGNTFLATTSGSVGIGTTSPAYKLDVVGSTSTARFGKLIVVDDTPFYTGANINSGANSLGVGSTGATHVGFFTNNLERARITAAGDVGIGTTSPSERLHVSGGGSDGAIRVVGGASGNGYLIARTTGEFDVLNVANAALRFYTNSSVRATLDASGNLGIGTSSPTARLHVVGTTQSVTGSTGIQIYGDGGSGYVNSIGANPLIFQVNTSERMRIDASGNVGIGTNSSSFRLTTNYTAPATFTNAASDFLQMWQASGVNALGFAANTTGTVARFVLNNNYNFAINNAVSELMRIDTAGNVAFSATIPTWNTAGNIVLTNNRYLSSTGSGIGILANGYFDVTDSRWEYTSTAAASWYNQSAGQHIWYNAAVGTANTALSWTQAMTLDTSGNLGLGVTPSAWGATSYRAFQVGGGSAFLAGRVGAMQNREVNFGVGALNNETNWVYNVTGAAVSRYQQTDGQHQWFTAPSGTAGTAISFTQAMTLDASGNLGVGVTSPDARLRVNGTAKIGEGAASNTSKLMVNTVSGVAAGIQLFQDGNESWIIQNPASTTALTFANSGTERLRITSGGNFIQSQAAESAQNASVTLTVANLQAGIITSNAAVTLTLPTGTNLDTYTTSMATNTAFECTFIATTANAITIAANGNTTVGNLTVSGNTSGTFRFRKTAANTFTVYRVA